MQTLLSLARRIDACNERIGRFVGWLLLVMVLVGAYNAVARYLERDAGLQLSSNALLELQWYFFGAAFLLGAPYALKRGAHVRVDVLYGGLGARARCWIDLVGAVLFLIPACACAVWLSLDFVLESWRSNEWSNDPGGLPRWPIKPVIPIGFTLLMLRGVSEAVHRAAALTGDLDDPPDQAAKAEEAGDGS